LPDEPAASGKSCRTGQYVCCLVARFRLIHANDRTPVQMSNQRAPSESDRLRIN